MCITVFQLLKNPFYKFIIAFNRDEFCERKTLKSHYWFPKYSFILAGKDVLKGGTWMGLNTKIGTFSCLTNFRKPVPAWDSADKLNQISRGVLIPNYLMFNSNGKLDDTSSFDKIVCKSL